MDDLRNRGWVRSKGGGEVCRNQLVTTMETFQKYKDRDMSRSSLQKADFYAGMKDGIEAGDYASGANEKHESWKFSEEGMNAGDERGMNAGDERRLN